jgi:hypothetical protein
LGFPWFAAFNPEINWMEGTMDHTPLRVYSQAAASQKPQPITKKGGARQRNTQDRELIFGISIRPETINKTTISTKLAAKKAEGQEKKDWSELVPSAYHHHTKVFSKKAAERLPPHRKWDHVITLTPDAPKTLKCKTYAMTLKEQDAIDEILEEGLKKKYIKHSDSPCYVLAQ